MKGPRYSLAPVEALFPRCKGYMGSEADPAVPLTEVLGVNRAQIQRWRTDGLTTHAADRLAVRIGWMPQDLWPSWYDDADLEPACEMCGEPISDGRSICSVRCKDARRRVRHRQTVAA